MGGWLCPWLSSMHNKQYKDFPVCSQKECCFQIFMSGFEIRDFGLFVKTEQIETLSAWQKEREHYKILGTQYLFHGGAV